MTLVKSYPRHIDTLIFLYGIIQLSVFAQELLRKDWCFPRCCYLGRGDTYRPCSWEEKHGLALIVHA